MLNLARKITNVLVTFLFSMLVVIVFVQVVCRVIKVSFPYADELSRYTFVWLIYQLSQRDIVTDKTEVSSIFAGTRKGAKADSIVQAAGAILDDYEQGKVFVHEA